MDEINISLTTINSNASNADSTIISIGDEKSLFERAIIEAYKQKHNNQIYEKLSIALDEIKFMVSDITNSISSKDTSTKKYLLNKNILDKISRIIERKFFNVNILIAKLFENLLDSNNFSILSNDVTLLINFANEVLNLLESINSTIVSRQLEKKCHNFLDYLIKKDGLNEDQSTAINELVAEFPLRNSSSVFKSFDSLKESLIKSCKNLDLQEKLDGINKLMESFGNTASLEEQFDLLVDKVSPIIKAIIHQPNPEFADAYFQLGNFICSILFATKFKVDAHLPEYRLNLNDLNKNSFFLVADDEIIDESCKYHVSFLHNTVYELTTQKEILTKCENVFNICMLVLNTLSIYESIFDLQFVCYIILKRIYFTFPKCRGKISDLLAVTLVNLCSFKDKFEHDTSEECRLFLQYLLNNEEEDFKNKIKKRLESKNVSLELQEYEQNIINEVEQEPLKLSDFNLRIGYPSSSEIEAGTEMSKYVEVFYPNSLVYVGFATLANDINFHLMRYIPDDETTEKTTDDTEEDPQHSEYTDKGHFINLFKLDRIDSSVNPIKIVLFVPEPGTYKLIFDNTFSWFTSKTLRYRISVLKPISEINLSRRVEFDKMRSEAVENLSQSNVQAVNPHDNKILMVKVEGVNRVFNLGKIYLSESAIVDGSKYFTIPVLLTKDTIRIFVTHINEFGVEVEEFKETKINLADNLLSEGGFQDLETIFEKEMDKYLQEFDSGKIIFLSTFICEKQLNQVDKSTVNLTNSNDSAYMSSLNKLGFYPESTLTKFDNVKFFTNSLADSCVLYSLYEKVINDEKFANIIHIHFDKYKVQASLYFEGVINDKISGLNYDYSKTLLENVDNVLEFVNKVIVIFGSFDLSVSFTDIDEKLFELFTEELEAKIKTLETQINFQKKDKSFIFNVLKGVHLFQMAY